MSLCIHHVVTFTQDARKIGQLVQKLTENALAQILQHGGLIILPVYWKEGRLRIEQNNTIYEGE
jgi:hypothetical protein